MKKGWIAGALAAMVLVWSAGCSPSAELGVPTPWPSGFSTYTPNPNFTYVPEPGSVNLNTERDKMFKVFVHPYDGNPTYELNASEASEVNAVWRFFEDTCPVLWSANYETVTGEERVPYLDGPMLEKENNAKERMVEYYKKNEIVRRCLGVNQYIQIDFNPDFTEAQMVVEVGFMIDHGTPEWLKDMNFEADAEYISPMWLDLWKVDGEWRLYDATLYMSFKKGTRNAFRDGAGVISWD